MKRLLENHTLKNNLIRHIKTNDIYTIENVYEMSMIGNVYISLLVYKSDKTDNRTHSHIDWEMLELDEDSDIGIHWNEHINDNRKEYEFIK